jgi:hypothetical protein
MHAQLIRAERFGEPKDAFQRRAGAGARDRPARGAGLRDGRRRQLQQRLGGLGIPIDVIGARNKKGEPEDFHIGGSDASGIVWKVGKDVTNVKVGDEVVVHCGMVGPRRPARVKAGKDPMYAPSPHLGLRDQLGQLRPVHQGAGPPVPAQAQAPDLGGGGRLHAGGRHRLPHAARLGRQRARARTTRCWSGAAPAGSAPWPSRSSRRPAARPSPWWATRTSSTTA